MDALDAEARSFGVASVFAFTYIPGFFQNLGFREVDRGALPLKAWKDCLRCPKFQCCDEIAVIKDLVNMPLGVVTTPMRGDLASTGANAAVPLRSLAHEPSR
jgi:hypothetical protein